MTQYIVELINHTYTIKGLPKVDPFGEETVKPDTELVLFGMHSECNTVEEICGELHRLLYDELQINSSLGPDDTFLVSAHTYRSEFDETRFWNIPEQQYRVYDRIHVILDDGPKQVASGCDSSPDGEAGRNWVLLSRYDATGREFTRDEALVKSNFATREATTQMGQISHDEPTVEFTATKILIEQTWEANV